MQILVLGGNGQVGFELVRALAPFGDLQITTRSGVLPGGERCLALDMADADAVAGLVRTLAPRIVVNAAAYTAVDRAEDEAELAFRVNADAVAAVAGACASRGSLLVHYSTDYVFDGDATEPWREDGATSPLGVYGASKRAGELAIQESGCSHLILRTAWVYAARGQNFLRTMLRLGAERPQLSVVADQRGAPTPARWIAAATSALLARSELSQPMAELLHLSAGGECSWHGFADAIFDDAVAAGILDRAPELRAISSAEYPTRARRPMFSRLDNSRLAQRHRLALPDWRIGLRQVIAELSRA
jgi:dTDP-4-dehydrorhamnose reductase